MRGSWSLCVYKGKEATGKDDPDEPWEAPGFSGGGVKGLKCSSVGSLMVRKTPDTHDTALQSQGLDCVFIVILLKRGPINVKLGLFR